VVREQHHETGEEKQTEMLHGFTEDDKEDFNREWEEDAAPHFSSHNVQLQLTSGSSSSSGYSHGSPARGGKPSWGRSGKGNGKGNATDYNEQDEGYGATDRAFNQRQWRASPY